jgi:transposase InsO family protein
MMESEWELDRIRLFQLHRTHPDWTLPCLARVLQRSLSWVKKWLKRFREAGKATLEMFKSQSRAPHSHPRQVVAVVRDAILSLRDELKAVYGRVVGPKTILYHLQQDALLQAQGVYLPRSTRTIWQVLKDGGRIPTRVREHHPIERPDPMQHWEMDFGQLGDAFEFLSVVDRGTSILVHTQTQPHFKAETALLAGAKLLVTVGLPHRLRFDNDPRWVGNWRTDGYPSPLMRFLLCLGVEPDLVEPGKPQHKPFVERSVRTLKHECLWIDSPEDWLDAAGILDGYRQFYNHKRANQSLACGNRPPFEAFPTLPELPQVPAVVDPDAWLSHYHRRIFKRRVGSNGTISVGTHNYYLGYAYAGEPVGVLLDAQGRVFHMLHRSTVIVEKEIQGLVGHPLPFQDYLKQMLVEAQTIDRN